MLERDIALVDELRSQAAEHSLLEFKQDNADPKLIAKLCSALSNSARVEQKDCAYVLWGIHDKDHRIVGTQFDPETKTVGNQVFQLWLAQRLSPSIGHFGIENKNAAQASQVIKAALARELIQAADPEHPRAGYVPCWA